MTIKDEKLAATFEASLSEIEFNGIPIGLLLSNEICLRLITNTKPLTNKKLYIVLLQFLRHFFMFKSHNSLHAKRSIDGEYVLLTSIDVRNNYLGNITKLCTYLSSKYDVRVLHFKDHLGLEQFDFKNLISRTGNNWSYYKEWIFGFLPVASEILKRTVLNVSLGNLAVRLQFFVSTIVQTQRVVFARNFLVSNRPKYVITEFDKNTDAVTIITAARSIGVPTFSLLHGLITYLQPYWPLAAEYWFVWGSYFKEYLVQRGADSKRILISGAIQHEEPQDVSGNIKKTLIVLATNPINRELNANLTEIFCKMSLRHRLQVSENRFLVRIHPSEKLEDYKHFAEKYKGIEVDDGSKYTLEESLKQAKIVVTHNSAFAIDAVVYGARIIQLMKPTNDDFFTSYVDFFRLQRAMNEDELEELLLEETQNKKKVIMDSLFNFFGKVAVRQTIDQIEKKIG